MDLSKPETMDAPRRHLNWFAVVLVGFVEVLGARAVVSLVSLTLMLLVPGENTTGEAGRIFYAQRFLAGQLPFLPGDKPPYYPAVHGVLLHTGVGAIGRLLSLSHTDLYFVGRAISLLFTLAALFLAWRLLYRQQVPLFFRLGFVLALLAPFELIQHTTSYRPDNWLLGLGVIALYVLALHKQKVWAVPVLVVIVVISFFVKATGLALALAVCLALIRQGQWRASLAFVVLTAAVLLTSTAGLQHWSQGLFLSNLRNIENSPVSPAFTLSNVLSSPGIWLPLLFLILSALLPSLKARDEFPRLVQTFGIVALLTAVFAGMRSGSAPYYFLEPYFYCLLFLTCLCSASWKNRALTVADGSRWRFHAALVSFFVILNLPSAIADLATGQHSNPSAILTARFAEERTSWAERIEETGIRYWSDDPGLNARVANPPILYPRLQSYMIKQGVLSFDSFTAPLERQEYDVVLFTGVVWSYQGAPTVPEEWEAALQLCYQRVDTNGGYQVWVPGGNVSE